MHWPQIRTLPCTRPADLPGSRSFQPAEKPSDWEYCHCKYCWMRLRFLRHNWLEKKALIESAKNYASRCSIPWSDGVCAIFAALALLPEHALTSRLGETGAQLRRLGRGEGMRTLALCEPQSQFEEAMELESPVETIESLSFVLNRLLEQLCARLEARALAVQELRLRLQLERRVADEQTTTMQELNGFLPELPQCGMPTDF